MSGLKRLSKPITVMGVRYINGPKRKYPVKPDHANELPVFQYTVSKKNYKRVFSWGNAQTGALGLKGLIDRDVEYLRFPKRMTFGEKFEVTHAAAGFGFSLFAVHSDTNIKLYGTGLNTDSQIGHHEIRKGYPLEVIFYPQPISLPLKYPEQTKIKKLSAGRAHILVLTDEGVFTLGNNAYGQCGRKIIENEDYFKGNVVHFIEDIEGKQIVDVECGQDHSLLITEDGSVYSCGWSADGQTGLGHFKNTEKFSQVKGDIENEKIVQVSCRSDFCLALNDKGDVFGWGNTEYGQISLPNNEQQLAVPSYINILKSKGRIKGIASGGTFCLVVNEEGEVFSWGYGLLGLGPNVQLSKRPLKIPETLFGKSDFQPNSLVKQVVCGLNYAAAVSSLGDLFMWGRNKNGCLGLGIPKDQYFPFKVSLGGTVERVFCGIDHTLALCKPFV